MDGVLVDSESFWSQAEYEVFTALGVHVTHAEAAITKSMTTSEVTDYWFNKQPWEGTKYSEVEEMVVSRVIDFIETEPCEIPGVRTFIKSIKDAGFKLGLATNSPQKIIPTVLKKMDMLHFFDVILSAEFERKGKPQPDIYLNAARRLGIDTQDCVVFEDSYSGILAAKNAGMTVVAFTNGSRDSCFEIADYTIDSFMDFDVDGILHRFSG